MRQSSEPVIIDPASFAMNSGEKALNLRSTFNCYCATCTKPVTLRDLMANARYLLLAPTTVEAFIFRSKRWLKLEIPDLEVDRHPGGHGRSDLRLDSLSDGVRKALTADCAKSLLQRREALGVAERRNGRYPSGFEGQRTVLHFHGNA